MLRFLISICFLLLTGVSLSFAQTDTEDFSVRVLIGSDTIPPSVPVLQTVTPIAYSQIDIDWSASTDNYLLSGYLLYRDGVPLATTTLLSYSDTGLSATTTYIYIVRAFDSSDNYSATSSSLSTTTLDVPPLPAAPPKVPDGTAVRVVVNELLVVEGVSTTSLELIAARPARIEIRWGKTTSYELGYVVSNVYTSDHAVLLTELEPETKYSYQIIGYTPHGNQRVVKSGTFTTRSIERLSAPMNVSQFQAISDGNDVDLSWQVVAEAVSQVRVVRSHLGFPKYPQDGAIIYQGNKTSYKDVGILSKYSPVYYTAFAYDKYGNISSGAVALAYGKISLDGEVTNNEILGREESDGVVGQIVKLPEIISEATSSLNKERVKVEMKMPQSSEISIVQRDLGYSMLDNNIKLDPEHSFSVAIPKDSIAGNLKSIVLTVVDPTDNRKAYSFLLRINKDQTAYEAVISPLGVIGESQIEVRIYDYQAFAVATYKAPLEFAEIGGLMQVVTMFPDVLYKNTGLIAGGFITLLLLLFSVFWFFHRKS